MMMANRCSLLSVLCFFCVLPGLSQSYVFQREISGRTQQPGLYDFQSPVAVATDPLGNVYVADQDYIVSFDATGSFLLQWKIAGNGFGLATDTDGDVYVT